MRFEVCVVYTGGLDEELDSKLRKVAGQPATFRGMDLGTTERELCWMFNTWVEAVNCQVRLEAVDPRVTVHCDPPAH